MFGVVSPYLVALVVAWVTAHATKYVITLVKHEKKHSLATYLFISGGMPSSHTASVVAVTLVIALKDGVQTGLFGLAAVVVLITVYDAVKVRRSSGEQGLALRALIREQKSDVPLPRAAQGHTPIEVIVGAILGTAIGVVVFLATK